MTNFSPIRVFKVPVFVFLVCPSDRNLLFVKNIITFTILFTRLKGFDKSSHPQGMT